MQFSYYYYYYWNVVMLSIYTKVRDYFKTCYFSLSLLFSWAFHSPFDSDHHYFVCLDAINHYCLLCTVEKEHECNSWCSAALKKISRRTAIVVMYSVWCNFLHLMCVYVNVFLNACIVYISWDESVFFSPVIGWAASWK